MAEVDADLDRLIVDAFVAADNTAVVSPESTPTTSPELSPLSSISADTFDDNEIEELALPPSAQTPTQNTFKSLPYVLVPPAPYPTKPTPKHQGRKVKSAAQTARDKARSHLRRKLKRQKSKETPPQVQSDQKKPKTRIFLSCLPILVLVDAEVVQHSGYIGKAAPLPEKRAYSLKELEIGGFQVVRYKASVTQPLLEKKTGSVVGWIAAGPKDSRSDDARSTDVKKASPTLTWTENCDLITETIRELRPKCKFPKTVVTKTQMDLHRQGLGGPHVLEPRRGVKEAITCGISLGNGQTKPQQLRQNRQNREVWEVILNNHAFIRLSGWISGLFVTWAPLLFLYYANMITSLLASDSSLSRPFANSVFSAFTVNFGPNTITYPHRDLKNLAFGLCAITAFGDYDWRKGGHLVLFDLKLVIEFPPGTTIFIPSSVLCHANTTIQPGEERYSLVHFSAGSLFRWVEQGFQAANLYWKTRTAAEKAWKSAERWRSGLAMFSTLQQLRDGVVVE
ncbi:hypothetical protein V5O48_013380 [Marasmius crinis-equi]|uniref:Prolyl 4-hydroxylase alpha subunit Fe(2+) 2OG dioxygenase domain-containing protein n=1 Tax=Marasmius crinis-equi TaxID=585013 RepID=A0ABR3F090_9AGAR